MIAIVHAYNITWELLSEDSILDDEPVRNLNYPSIATALSESLDKTGKESSNALVTTNYGICATLKMCCDNFSRIKFYIRKKSFIAFY